MTGRPSRTRSSPSSTRARSPRCRTASPPTGTAATSTALPRSNTPPSPDSGLRPSPGRGPFLHPRGDPLEDLHRAVVRQVEMKRRHRDVLLGDGGDVGSFLEIPRGNRRADPVVGPPAGVGLLDDGLAVAPFSEPRDADALRLP